ncbi:MAG: Nre family DNA repair protein [Sulfolobales archaeon]
MRCRGSKYLCGLAYCPIVVETIASIRVKRAERGELDGSSPPSVFIGREGYPFVRVYPASPPVKGDTSHYEDPSKWIHMDLEEFLTMRLSLVRGYKTFRVYDANNPTRELEEIAILSMSPTPLDVEMLFERSPRGDVILSEISPPMGPSAPLKRISITSSKPLERVVEKVYSDRDLKASEAIAILYRGGIDVHRISRILSIGAIGRKRRLVPTRWAITAVDKIVSDTLLERVKEYKLLDSVLLFKRSVDKNLFIAIMIPHTWAFEWGEAWYPGTTWNMWGSEPWVEIDYEGYHGRKDYPGIGGCYYASRLATLEALSHMRRQAAVITWREIYEGFNLPIGVWYVRENMRAMYRSKPEEFSDLGEALKRVGEIMRTPIKRFLARSGVYSLLTSKKITSYIGDRT